MLQTPSLASLVVALATKIRNEIGCPHPKSVYFKALLSAMHVSRLVVCERPLLVFRINDKPIAEYTPDFIVQEKEILVVNLISSPEITGGDVGNAQACLDAHRGAASGVLINFGGPRLAWMNISQTRRKYDPHYRRRA
jgi:hypothetical protein